MFWYSLWTWFALNTLPINLYHCHHHCYLFFSALPNSHTPMWLICVCVFGFDGGCRCVSGSVQTRRGAPLASSHAAPSPPLMEAWRTEEWQEETPLPTLKLASATSPSVHSPPPRVPPRPPPPRPPCLPMAAADWAFMRICPTVRTPPPAACIITMSARREARTLIT